MRQIMSGNEFSPLARPTQFSLVYFRQLSFIQSLVSVAHLVFRVY